MSLIIKSTGFEDYIDRSGGAYIKALIMGSPNAGKTRSASYWPKPIYADCEKGRMSIADRGVPYAEVRTSADLDALLFHLKADSQKSPEARQYQTFVLDTIDSYQRVLIQERLRKEKKEALSGWQDWGYLDGKMQQLFERLLNLPMNIVVNLHVKDEADGDDDSKMQIHKAKLKGDIKDQIAAEFDLVGHMEAAYVAEAGERVLTRHIRWHAEPRYPLLKDRSGQLPRFTPINFSEADYQSIFDAIVSPHMEQMPAATELEELEVEGDVEPAPDDLTGGPVEPPTLRSKPAKKTAAKKVAKKAAAPAPPETAGADSAPDATVETGPAYEPDPVEMAQQLSQTIGRAAVLEHEPDEAQAETNVTAILGAQKVEEEPVEPARGLACGSQPAHLTKYDPVPGCGNDITENVDQLQIRLLKTKTYLCADCFMKWKTAA